MASSGTGREKEDRVAETGSYAGSVSVLRLVTDRYNCRAIVIVNFPVRDGFEEASSLLAAQTVLWAG